MNQHDENIEIMKDLRSRLDKVINDEPSAETTNYVPNPKKHMYVSFAKSVFRIAAGIALIAGSLMTAGAFLIVAEVLGVAEELV